MRVPPESRMVVKRFPSRHPLPLPCGRGGRAQRGRRGQITATSNRKMLAPSQADDVPRAQGLSVTCGDSSPKGRAKASYIGTRNGAYLYRYAPFTVLRLPLNARAARKSDGRKTVSVPAPPCLPCGRGGRAQRGRRGQITATSNRKMLAPSQADDVPRAQGPPQSPAVTALPKGEPRHRILAKRNGAYLYRYAPFTVLRLPLNARAARKSDGRKTVSVPAPLASPLWERWPSAARTERANNGNVQSENAGTFAGR